MDNTQPAEPFDLNAFLGSLAHDLANPLNAISMNAELVRLLAQKNQTERLVEITERILTDCSRCSRFLRDLRQFGDATKRRPRETVPAQQLVDAAEVAARAYANGQFPDVRLAGAETALKVERAATEAALSALLRNAAEAGAKIVEVAFEASEEGVVVTVTDDGAGIAEGATAKLGSPFFSTRRQQGNTGLGLALCAVVARAHGGELVVQPGATAGARAQMRLPPETRAS